MTLNTRFTRSRQFLARAGGYKTRDLVVDKPKQSGPSRTRSRVLVHGTWLGIWSPAHAIFNVRNRPATHEVIPFLPAIVAGSARFSAMWGG
jgi:hypothetical protein